jgi:hypothetical protein
VRLALAVCAVLLLTCCNSQPRHQSVLDEDVVVSPPTAADIQVAVDALGTDVARLYRGRWPSRFTASRDFPDQPLVVLLRVEDRGRTSADTAMLDDLLEQAVREQGYLRLYVDELSVPPSLREDYPQTGGGSDEPVEVDAGLQLEAWIDSAGRFRLLLRDAIQDKPLLRATSE